MEKILFNHHQPRKRVEWSGTEEQKNKPSTELPSEKRPPDIPELSENCGTSQTTAVSVSVAWTVGGDLHLSITGSSVSRKGGGRQDICEHLTF